MAGVTRTSAKQGTDWSLYTPISELITTTTAVGGTYQEEYAVTGKGFLSTVLLSSHSVDDDARLKITVDGNVIFNGTQSAANKFIGLVQSKETIGNDDKEVNVYIQGVNPGGTYDLNDTIASSYPQTTEANESCCLLASEIFFNTSLSIEITSTTGTTSLSLRVAGGYIA